MVRILLVVHGYPPTHSAGAEGRAARMARWFVQHGDYVEVVAVESVAAPAYRVERDEYEGHVVHRLHYRIDADAEGVDPLKPYYEYALIGATIQQVLDRGSFDLMHVISGYLIGHEAILAARRIGIRVVLTLTEFWFMCPRLNLIQATLKLCSGPETAEKCTRCLMESKRRYRLPAEWTPELMDVVWPLLERTESYRQTYTAVIRRDKALRQTLRAVDVVICPSRFIGDMFLKYGFEIDRFVFIRQGLTDVGSSALPVQRERRDPHVLRLGYIGQIKPHKGVDLLVEAVAGLLADGKPVELHMWGSTQEDNAYGEKLVARTAPLGDRVRWHGRFANGRSQDALARIDALVVPSRWYENSPNVILEAYAMGVPVVATNLGGMAELVRHEHCGLLFEVDDVTGLRQQIDRLLLEPGLLERLKSNIPRVKSIDEEAAEIVDCYKRAMVQPVVAPLGRDS